MRTVHRTFTLAAALAALSCGGTGQDTSTSTTSEALDAQSSHEPPMLGIHWARGEAGGQASTSPLMTWHGGAILTTTAVQAIFWGTSWSSASFVGDKIGGIDTFYGGIGGSSYAGTNTEYDGTNGLVTTAVSYGGSQVDSSPAPRQAPKTSTILNEVCARISNPVANGFYPVYVDTPRGHTRYCAWHSYGTCNGVPVQFGFFFHLDGDPGCDPQDTSGLHSQGLAALANVSGHEFSETMTDPRNGGWYDSSGSENADKCAWTFGAPLLTFSDGTQWKVQGNWSNAAYSAGTGYPNGAGQDGCIGTK
ncbi:hypothetical protein [Anaeromyxobacter oryzae]|uniref:Uncharacterized protein n=1 Tax=Anaeromyxobacter oryzae TaxID=2918170 RepID=A0ABM7WUJ3_9BACT|nr:hypothetical protein [Anaeromyxobacter oryzae]BDG03157.1 hypothetical protein AMOR_21530 [Anaeromyxobacter oryzae]